MGNDIGTMIWKELKEVIARGSQSRSEATKIVVVVAVMIGVLIWRSTLLMSNLGILILPSFILVQLLGSMMADSFAGERERHTLETLLASRLSDSAILIGKICAGVLLVWGLMFVILGLGALAAFARGEASQMQIAVGDLAMILSMYML